MFLPLESIKTRTLISVVATVCSLDPRSVGIIGVVPVPLKEVTSGAVAAGDEGFRSFSNLDISNSIDVASIDSASLVI